MMFDRYKKLYFGLVVSILLGGCDGGGGVENNPVKGPRLVKLSCVGEGFDVDNDPGFIQFNSSTFPSVSEKVEQLSARSVEMVFGVEGGVLSVFAGLALPDALVPLTTLHCNYELYSASRCQLTSFLTGGDVTIEDVKKVGEQLTYTIIDKRKNSKTTVTYANPNYDGFTIDSVEDGVTNLIEWKRKRDGTETLMSTSSSGEVVEYTENPDCSGNAHIVKTPKGKKSTYDFEWTSTKESTFTLNYKVCATKSGAFKCESGTL